MEKLYDDIKTLLQQDKRFVVEGKLLKNKISELALAMDDSLLRLLLSDAEIKKHFFTELDGLLVFDKIKFQRFINNKQFLPDSYTAFKNKIGLTSNEEYITESKDVVLAWPYKDCVLEGGQTKDDAKRNEIFWNETLAPDEIDLLLSPKVLKNFKKFDKDGEHKVTAISKDDNLIIKGNNLLALQSLKKTYANQIKLIYIDPPYNTGSDSFLYNDSFNHSTWLSFMKNRLQVAKELLKNDGVIFVQCDDNEQAYLKVLLDEIFKDNYLVSFYIRVRYEGKTLVEDMDFQKMIETIHVYGKTPTGKLRKKESAYEIDKFIWTVKELEEPEIIELGGKKVGVFKKGQYKFEKGEPGKEKLKEIWASGKVLDGNSSGRFFRDYLTGRYTKDGLGVLYKVYGIGEDSFDYRYFTGPQKDGATKGKYFQGVPLNRLDDSQAQTRYSPVSNFYDLADAFGNCRQEGAVELRSGKKPEELLKLIIELSTDENDLILDYHFGTGTTGAVAHKLNRRFIGIEQLDYGNNDSVIRLKNVIDGDKTGISDEINWQGGGSFIYCELAKANQEYVDKIQEVTSKKQLQAIWATMQEKAFISYYVDTASINDKAKNFDDLTLQEQQKFLIEILDKNLLYIPYSGIEDKDYNVSNEEIKLNHNFYSLK